MNVVGGIDSHSGPSPRQPWTSSVECSTSHNSPTATRTQAARHMGERPRCVEDRSGGLRELRSKRVSSSPAGGHDVREVPAFLTHRERKKRPSKGKSDPSDAIAIARVVAREEPLFSVQRSPILEDLKLLSDHHDQLKRARNQTANRTHRCLVALDPAYHERIPNLTAAKHIASVLRFLRGNNSVRGANPLLCP